MSKQEKQAAYDVRKGEADFLRWVRRTYSRATTAKIHQDYKRNRGR